jgi:hypothetical protein
VTPPEQMIAEEVAVPQAFADTIFSVGGGNDTSRGELLSHCYTWLFVYAAAALRVYQWPEQQSCRVNI